MIHHSAADQGGSGVVLIDSAGTAAWTPPVANAGQYVFEVVVISPAGATFSTLTGGDNLLPFTVGTGVAGATLPMGSYRMRLKAVTISSGKALLFLS